MKPWATYEKIYFPSVFFLSFFFNELGYDFLFELIRMHLFIVTLKGGRTDIQVNWDLKLKCVKGSSRLNHMQIFMFINYKKTNNDDDG